MAFADERVEVEIEFTQEGEETAVAELTDLLAQLEEVYIRFEEEHNLIADISPYDMNEEIYYDEEAKEMFIGRLYRYGILNQSDYPFSVRRFPPRYTDPEYDGLKISHIKKESPLLIGITGGGVFLAVLWIIEGIEYERDATKRIDEDGNESKEVTSNFKFNATSTKELISEVRKFFRD